MSKQVYTNINMRKNSVENMVLHNSADDIINPVQGLIYFNTTLKKVKYYDGTSWIVL